MDTPRLLRLVAGVPLLAAFLLAAGKPSPGATSAGLPMEILLAVAES